MKFEVHASSGDVRGLPIPDLSFDADEDRYELEAESLDELVELLEEVALPVLWVPGGQDLPVLEFVDDDEGPRGYAKEEEEEEEKE